MDQPQEEFIEPQSARSNPDKEHADEVEHAEMMADFRRDIGRFFLWSGNA
jgi:hypothetical protein